MITSVIIPAAGTGIRFGASIPKQFVELDGVPIIIRTINAFDCIEGINNFILAVHKDWIEYSINLISKFNINKPIDFLLGGEQRQDSVFNALQSKFLNSSDIVLIHDAVRPYPGADLINSIIDAAKNYGAAIPGVRLSDTIKKIDNDNFVIETPDRKSYRAIQTPQGFKKNLIVDSYESAMKNAFYSTDDSALVEYAGFKVKVVEGQHSNIKITTSDDIIKSHL